MSRDRSLIVEAPPLRGDGFDPPVALVVDADAQTGSTHLMLLAEMGFVVGADPDAAAVRSRLRRDPKPLAIVMLIASADHGLAADERTLIAEILEHTPDCICLVVSPDDLRSIVEAAGGAFLRMPVVAADLEALLFEAALARGFRSSSALLLSRIDRDLERRGDQDAKPYFDDLAARLFADRDAEFRERFVQIVLGHHRERVRRRKQHLS